MSGSQHSYKFQRLREAIRAAIQRGELANKLPGERELARRFGVNAKTISKALTDLTVEGLLVRQIGRGTFVAGHESADRMLGSGRQYLWLASEQLNSSFLQAMYESARTRFAGRGHHIQLKRVVVDANGELPERCVPISRLKELAGVIVFSSIPGRALLGDLCRRHLPLVLCNTTSLSIKVNCVIADYSRGVFELTEHLAQLGHTKILLAIDRHALCAAYQAQRGYQTAMARYGLAPLPLIRCPAEDPSAILALSTPPSAIVCVGGHLAAELKGQFQLTNRGNGQLPSLVAMGAPGQLTAQKSGISTYDVYPDQVLDWSMQLLFEHAPGVAAREVIVPGVFNDRGSSAPAENAATLPKAHPIVL